MAVTTEPQTAIDERPLDSTQLEQTLDEREKLKTKLSEARKNFKEADEVAKAQLAEFALTDGEVARCGNYRISKRSIPGRSVSFETEPRSRLSISLIDSDD